MLPRVRRAIPTAVYIMTPARFAERRLGNAIAYTDTSNAGSAGCVHASLFLRPSWQINARIQRRVIINFAMCMCASMMRRPLCVFLAAFTSVSSLVPLCSFRWCSEETISCVGILDWRANARLIANDA